MAKTVENTTIPICNEMVLELKEVRGTSTGSTYEEGYTEKSSNTQTLFHWRLRGIASKHSVDTVETDKSNLEDQEVYDLLISSHGWDVGFFAGYKSRDIAIRNALKFATRNGIEVDGYGSREE